ncbi:hypothetical protein PR002_g1088 [Phytophthora rubi]|uniref:HTH CENPB-type domain-containing protein n=1 Tax=Phytophthora rubi TaxID=129364 RepID=A0A6A3P135_9STRA|nr:hypothetical protein PR002_g1088 [Phytophthora rubi]
MPAKRFRLTWSEKVGLLAKADRTPAMSYQALAKWAVSEYGLPAAPGKTKICRIIKSRTALLGRPIEKAVRKNEQPRSHALLDENVVEFVLLAEEEGVSISGAMIIQHARDVAAKLRIPPELRPRFASSWLRRFQERYGIRWRRAYGESDSVELDTSQQEIARLRKLVSSYLPRNVFNMDETE